MYYYQADGDGYDILYEDSRGTENYIGTVYSYDIAEFIVKQLNNEY